MLHRLKALADHRDSFAFETTLTSRTVAPWLTSLDQQGYSVHVVVLWLRSVDLAWERVQERVRRGGHNVPEETVRRRYRTGLRNLPELYRGAATSWRLYDNLGDAGYELVASGTRPATDQVLNAHLWASVLQANTNG
jgi:predicted ABC-type ATPase